MAHRGNEQSDNTNHNRAAEQRHESTQHVDRVALLKEGSTTSNGTQQRHDAPANKAAEPNDGKLHVTDVYASTVSGYKGDSEAQTRGLKSAEGKTHKHDDHEKHHDKEQKPSEKSADKPADKGTVKAEKPPETAILKNDDKNFDPHKPTVAYLDSFSTRNDNIEHINGTVKHTKDGQPFADGKGVSHGELSARGAEQNGYNVYRVESNTNSPDHFKHEDYSKPLNEIADKIDNGQMKMGKGDVVNVSMGHNNPDMTFDQANKFLGMNGLNAENLKDRRPEVLDKLNQVANDKTRSSDDRAWAQAALDTNKAIDRLQAKGIHVMQAAGNDNTDKDKRFSIDFMNASDQLGSNKPSGKPDFFSADHSLVSDRGKTDGVYTFKYSGMDALSKTPVADQKGFYQADNANLRFEGSEIGQRLGGGNQTWNQNRETMFDNMKLPNQADSAKLDKSMFTQPGKAPDQTFSNDAVTKWNSNGFGGPINSNYFGDVSKAKPISVENNTAQAVTSVTDKPQGEDANDRAGWAAGTSFVNIRRLTEMHDQLMQEKFGGQ